VLLIDIDAQSNLTTHLGLGVKEDVDDLNEIAQGPEWTIYDVLKGSKRIHDVIIKRSENLAVVPSSLLLSAADLELGGVVGRELLLKRAIEKVRSEYDVILIDCPPALSLLTLNGLCAANGVIVPMQCEYFALEGLSDLVNTIKQVHANLNPDLVIIGLLRVMFDPRMMLSQQVSTQLEKHFGDKVFKTIIPRNVRLAEAPSYGVPGVIFDAGAKGAQAYVAFGKELVARLEK
jgi:chromosome partitioning protein